MHQGRNYQDFLKWGGCLNKLEGFILKICNLITPIEWGTKNPKKIIKKTTTGDLFLQSKTILCSSVMACIYYCSVIIGKSTGVPRICKTLNHQSKSFLTNNKVRNYILKWSKYTYTICFCQHEESFMVINKRQYFLSWLFPVICSARSNIL